MYKVFDTLEEYNQFTNDGANLTAGVIYYVNEDGSTHFQTNNIDGEEKVYDMIDGIPEGYIVPSGNKEITQNGTNIDVAQYATASVNVPIPEGYIVPSGNKEITQNGTNIDVAQYATASVAVPQPSGNISITANGENIDIAQYATATVNVPSGTEDLIDLIERDFTTFNIPSRTTKIGDYAFYYKRDLTSINIPNSVTTIGDSVFYYCEGLTSINIPNSVKTIGCKAFSFCSALISINSENEGEAIMPDSLDFISYDIFDNSKLIKMVYLPYNGVVNSSYTDRLFDTDYQNFIVYVPQEQYGNYWKKYYDSRGLILPYPRVESTNHTIQYTINSTGSQQVKVIYSEALKFVEKITINGTEVENPKNSTQQLVDGENVIKVWLYDSRITNRKLLYDISVNSVEIQNSVTTISDYTFGFCRALTSINIPNNVTTIGNSVFYYCEGLTSISIGNGVASIGDYAFYYCTSLTNINIPDSVTSIGYGAFDYCTSLTSITINATTPPSLGSNAFNNTNDCPIYVPAESLDAYKTATNWSSYASRIQAIPTE